MAIAQERGPRALAAREALASVVGRATEDVGIVHTAVPGLTVSRVSEPMPPTSYVYGPSLCVCLRGSKTIVWGNSRFVHDADNVLLTAIEMPTIIAIEDASPDRPYLGLQVNLDLELARQVIAEIDMGGAATLPADACMALAPLTEDLLDAVGRLGSLVEAPHDIGVMSGLIHREILYRLLSGASGERLRQIVRLGSQTNRVARAIAWLRDHYREPIRIEHLAQLAGMGVSTLHRRFHELTTLSPLQYQKHLRLHEARRLMVTDRLEAGTAALRVGYESVTQFNREYRRLFGESPMRHVKALRMQG